MSSAASPPTAAGCAIGALVRHDALASERHDQARLPDARACGRNHRALCHPQARHDRRQPGACRSGGAIAACRARARCRDRDRIPQEGSRDGTARDFFLSIFTTILESGRTAGRDSCAASSPQEGWGFRLFNRRAGDFAIVSVAAMLARGADDTVGGLAARDRRYRPGAGPRRATGGRRLAKSL